MKTPFVAVAVFVALILGAGLGWFLANDNQETLTPTAKNKDLPDLRQESLKLTAELHREIDDQKSEIRVFKAMVKTLEDQTKTEPAPAPETEDWEGKYTEAESEIDDLKAKLEAAEKPEPETESTMYVDWGKYSEIEGFRDADWKNLGETYSKMNEMLDQRRADIAAGKKFDQELQAKIIETNNILVKHYAKIYEAVESEFSTNGAFTHPANLVNILAGQLDSAEKPLSDEQLSELKTLAEEYDSKWEKEQSGFTDKTWKLEKMQAEAELKEWFKAEMFKVTTPEQKELALPATLDDLVGLDMYSASLNLMTITKPLTAASEDELKTQLKASVAAATKLSAEQVESANYIFDQWMFSVQDRIGPFSTGELQLMYTTDLLKALNAQLVALHALHNDIATTDGERASIATQSGILLLRLRKTD